jgi:hypothetical protein
VSERLRPYTVSGVVDTATGDLVGTPITRAGHEDYRGFDTVRPLNPSEQFRWVHIWARDDAAAAITDALTADLRPGGNRSQPLARALSGTAGLKPFTVAAVVRRHSGRPIADPVAIAGHHDLDQAAYEGQRTRSSTTHVWARSAADAIGHVFGSDRAGGVGSSDTVRPTGTVRAPEPADDANDTTPSVRDEWHRLADRSAAERIRLIADDVWRRWYPPAYHHAYVTAAGRIAAAATDAAVANPRAWMTLHQLAAAAGDAINQQRPEHVLVPPADLRTVAAAKSAATSANASPWQAVAAAARVGGRRAATLAGTAHASVDVLSGWRRRGGQTLAEGVTVADQPACAWVGKLLTAISRDAAAPAPRTAAQLAHEDQAPGTQPWTAGRSHGGAASHTPPFPTPRRAP